MTPNQQIEKIADSHTVWVKYVSKRLTSANLLHAEDVVQAAYLKTLNTLNQNKDKVINFSYFYQVLNSIMRTDGGRVNDPLKHYRAIANINNIPEEIKEHSKPRYSDLKEDIENVVENFYVFDKNLFNAYRYEFSSIRKLSKATKIGQRQVFETVKKCKEKINQELKNKYYGKAS